MRVEAEIGTGMRVGLLGAGRIGAFHAGLLRASPLVGSLTVVDSDPQRAWRAASELGVETAVSPEALLERGVDAVVIAAATPSHASLICLAAEAGVPAFCEKPIALDLATTDRALRRVAEAGTMLQIGFQRRFDPGYAAAREALASGALGELLLFRVAGHDPEPPPEEYVSASGGIFRDLHVHDFDAVEWVSGRRIAEVYADGRARDPMFARHGDVDTAAAVLRLDDGTLGVLSGSRYDPLGYDIRLELFGSRDSVTVGVDERTPLRSLEPGAAAPAGPGYRDFRQRFEAAYRAELEAFLLAAREGAPSPCPGEEARRSLLVALAAERSRQERRPVSVDEAAEAA